MNWSGSETKRREQGICLPPSSPPDKTKRFTLPAGTAVKICRVGDRQQKWMNYKTVVELGFSRYESYQHFHYTFRHEGWFIRVPVGKVRKLRTR